MNRADARAAHSSRAGEAGYFGPYYNDVWGESAAPVPGRASLPCFSRNACFPLRFPGTTDGANWTLLNGAAGFSKRSGNLLLNVAGALFTFGGYGLPMKHDAYCLPAGNASAEWIKLPAAPWKGRFDYDMVVFNGSIALLAGEASLFGTGGPYYNDVWRYEEPGCQ